MKKIVEHSLFLVIQIICLMLSILWYTKNWEMEPLIAIVTFSGAILITLFFKMKKDSPQKNIDIKKIKSKKTTDIKIESKEGDKNITDIQSGEDTNITIKE